MDAYVKLVAIFVVFTFAVLCQGAALDKNNVTETSMNATVTTTHKSSNESLNATSSTPTTESSTPTTESSTPTTEEARSLVHVPDTSGLLRRSLYVAIGISAIVAIYFIVRIVKTRGRRKAKKYGVIHGTGSAELEPLDKGVEEEEEDMTLFERKDTKWPR